MKLNALLQNPLNRKIDRAKVANIKQAIKVSGVIKPLVYTEVMTDKGKENMLTDGHHRYIALKEMGYKDAPVVMSDERGIATAQFQDMKTVKKAIATLRGFAKHLQGQHNQDSHDPTQGGGDIKGSLVSSEAGYFLPDGSETSTRDHVNDAKDAGYEIDEDSETGDEEVVARFLSRTGRISFRRASGGKGIFVQVADDQQVTPAQIRELAMRVRESLGDMNSSKFIWDITDSSGETVASGTGFRDFQREKGLVVKQQEKRCKEGYYRDKNGKCRRRANYGLIYFPGRHKKPHNHNGNGETPPSNGGMTPTTTNKATIEVLRNLAKLVNKHGSHDQRTHSPTGRAAIAEQEHPKNKARMVTEELIQSIRPAVRHEGKLYVGQKGDTHYEVRMSIPGEPDLGDIEPGFVDRRQSWMEREEVGAIIGTGWGTSEDLIEEQETLSIRNREKVAKYSRGDYSNLSKDLAELQKRLDKHTPGGQQHDQSSHAGGRKKNLRSQLRPAIRSGGKTFIGRKGQIHAEVMLDNEDDPTYGENEELGFADEKGNFLTRDEASQRAGIRTSEELNEGESSRTPKSISNVKQHLGTGTKVMISAERSNLSPQENAKRTATLRQELQSMGGVVQESDSKYGGVREKGFVFSISSSKLNRVKSLADKYNQDSVIVIQNGKAELRYKDGRKEYGNVSEASERVGADDNYSSIGGVKFTIPFKDRGKEQKRKMLKAVNRVREILTKVNRLTKQGISSVPSTNLDLTREDLQDEMSHPHPGHVKKHAQHDQSTHDPTRGKGKSRSATAGKSGFVTALKNRNGDYVEVFKNPSRKDLHNIESWRDKEDRRAVRAMLTESGDLIYWDTRALHHEVRDVLHLKEEAVPLMVGEKYLYVTDNVKNSFEGYTTLDSDDFYDKVRAGSKIINRHKDKIAALIGEFEIDHYGSDIKGNVAKQPYKNIRKAKNHWLSLIGQDREKVMALAKAIAKEQKRKGWATQPGFRLNQKMDMNEGVNTKRPYKNPDGASIESARYP